MAVEVTVANAAYWNDRPEELAQLLWSAGQDEGPATIDDPEGRVPNPDRILTVADPSYWSERPGELAEVMFVAPGISRASRTPSRRTQAQAVRSG